jgi:hypothetical protein
VNVLHSLIFANHVCDLIITHWIHFFFSHSVDYRFSQSNSKYEPFDRLAGHRVGCEQSALDPAHPSRVWHAVGNVAAVENRSHGNNSENYQS